MEVNVGASEAWTVYGTLRLAEIVSQQLSDVVHKIDVLEGDGGAGTVLLLTFQPDPSGGSSPWHKEKFTVVDNEKLTKQVEVIEGGYLEKGLDLFRIKLEIFEKQRPQADTDSSCITKVTVEFETKDYAAANLAVTGFQVFVTIMKCANDYLTKNNSKQVLLPTA